MALSSAALLVSVAPGSGGVSAAKASDLHLVALADADMSLARCSDGDVATYSQDVTKVKAATDTKAAANIVKAATKDQFSVTHDGITLKLNDLLYDGARLSFVLDREGVDLEGTLSPYLSKVGPDANEWQKSRVVPETKQKKGYIKPSPTILINGKKVEFGELAYGDYTKRENAFLVQVTRGLKSDWGDEFDLTIQVNVTRVKEPFIFKVPVKMDGKMIVLKPNAQKSYKTFSYTVKELQLTSGATRLVIDSTGKVPASSKQSGKYIASRMYYDIVDDQGNLLTPEKFGYYNGEPKAKYHIDELYSPVKGTPKQLTIKPFTLTVNKKDWSVVGKSKDSYGDKTYIKELEMTIPVKK